MMEQLKVNFGHTNPASEKLPVFENSFVYESVLETPDLVGIVNEWVTIEDDEEIKTSLIEDELDKKIRSASTSKSDGQ